LQGKKKALRNLERKRRKEMDKWDDVGCVKEYLSDCPYAEFTQIDDIYDDGDVYILTVGMAVRKEDLKND
jgi:hypothetical protein